MSHAEIDLSHRAVQTSLYSTSGNATRSLAQELEQLREDKSILEGKIRGYLTLSDICHEYKAELAKLQLEYNELKEKFTLLTAKEIMKTKPPLLPPDSESPLPDDLGTDTGNVPEHRTDIEHRNDPNSTSSAVGRRSLHQTGAIGTRMASTASPGPRIDIHYPVTRHRETVVMQESLMNESQQSMHDNLSMQTYSLGLNEPSPCGLGGPYVKVVAGATQGATGDDLMYFSQPGGPSSTATPQPAPPQAQLSEEGKLESLASVFGNPEREDWSRIVNDAVGRLVSQAHDLEEQKSTLKQSNFILIGENRKLTSLLSSQQQQINQHITNAKKMDEELRELRTRLPAPSLSAERSGWVQVEAVAANIPVSGTETVTHVHAPVNMDNQALRDQNKQLLDANSRWVSEWDKLQAHYQGKVTDLQTQRDELTRRITDLQIQVEQRQVEADKTLATSRKGFVDEEAAKEDALHQLTVASSRADTAQQRLVTLEGQLADRNRDNQALTAELAVVRKPGSSQIGGTPQPSRPPMAGNSSEELRTENEVLRQQLLLFHEDFDRERHDRATAQSIIDELRKNYDLQKRRIRHLEQNVVVTELKAKQLGENLQKVLVENGRIQKENSELKSQIRREQEASSRPYIAPYGIPQPPIVQTAGLHSPHGYMGQLYPQQPLLQQSPQPQQHVVQPLLSNQQAQMQPYAGLNYLAPAGSPSALPVPGVQYYQATTAGSQNEQLPGAWPCNSCTYVNYPGRTVCEMCGYVQTHGQTGRIAASTNSSEPLRPRGDQLLYGNGPPPQAGNLPIQHNGNVPRQHSEKMAVAN